MNNQQLFIPDKCKVGLQLRDGTYTGKLGYIIYHDGKKWRKEQSWESWRHKEGKQHNAYNQETGRWENVIVKGVEPIEFDNVPTEGFVLNKKAGGYSSGWNHRQTYSRVYDPRGWEFEITVPNLLYILQECSSFKGKGLEGEFVYSWDGKDLVLLPVSSPDYIACQEYTQLQDVKFNSREDLFEGGMYLTNKQEQWMYLGRYDVCMNTWGNRTNIELGNSHRDKNLFQKRHVFAIINGDYHHYEFLSSFNRIKMKLTEEPHKDFAEQVDKFLKSQYMGKPTHLVVENVTKKFLSELRSWGGSYVYKKMPINSEGDMVVAKKEIKRVKEDENKFEIFSTTRSSYSWRNDYRDSLEGTFTAEEIQANYGKLMRVYDNGYKTEV